MKVFKLENTNPGRVEPPEDVTTLDMIKNPQWWPHRVLALKRRRPKEFPETAVALYYQAELLLEEHSSIFVPRTPENCHIVTPEEIVERGWEVD